MKNNLSAERTVKVGSFDEGTFGLGGKRKESANNEKTKTKKYFTSGEDGFNWVKVGIN